MKVIVGSEIVIEQPNKEIIEFLSKNAIFDNPEYKKKKRLGLWIGDTPKELKLYRVIHSNDISSVIIPYGYLLDVILAMSSSDILEYTFRKDPLEIDFCPKGLNLRDYQEDALNALYDSGFGILQAPAGSGKTQIGIALAFKHKRKTLWITHKHDLLVQSKKRAEQYIDKSLIGTIEDGKVEIGQITFAIINTLSRLDLTKYRNIWDVIIVDECHHIAGSETQVTMFSKVLNNLSAPHKYGLSATLKRTDGLIKTTYAMIGSVSHIVPEEVVSSHLEQASIYPVDTTINLIDYIEQTKNGVLNYNKLLAELSVDMVRNRLIVNDLIKNQNQFCLILSERLKHLELLQALLPNELKSKSIFVHSKVKSKREIDLREQGYQAMRDGKIHYIFASYELAKEGLDIINLNRLFLVSPKCDETAVIQSIGRIERQCPNKIQPVVYDYVDRGKFAQVKFSKRKAIYKKKHCQYITKEELIL